MRRYCFIPLLLGALIAAGCSGEGGESAPTAAPTQVATAEAAGTPVPQPTEVAEGLSATQQEVADAIFTEMLEGDGLPRAVLEDQVRCLADRTAGFFSDERLDELEMNRPSIAADYEDAGGLLSGLEITDDEASELVDRALECIEWRAVIAEEIVGQGLPPDQASCIASEISSGGIRAFVMNALFVETVDGPGLSDEEVFRAYRACVDLRELLYETYLQEGVPEDSARCVVDGLPEAGLELLLEVQEREDEEETLELMEVLMDLQDQCLTPKTSLR